MRFYSIYISFFFSLVVTSSAWAAQKVVPDENMSDYVYLSDARQFACELSTGLLGKLRIDAQGRTIFKKTSKKKKKKRLRKQLKNLRSQLNRISRGSSSYKKAKRKLRKKRKKKQQFLELYDRCEQAGSEDPAPGDQSLVAFDMNVFGAGTAPVAIQLSVSNETPEVGVSCVVDEYPETVFVEVVDSCRVIVIPRILIADTISLRYYALRDDGTGVRSNQATVSLTWQQQPSGDRERLTVKEVVRLTHPAYAMNNNFYGANNPLNRDETRILMYELTNPNGDLERGRLYVWGHIAGQGCESQTPCLTNWETKQEYEQAAKQVPALGNDFSRNRWTKLYWSPLEGEEHILYGVPRTAKSIYRINVETNDIEEVVSFDVENGIEVSEPTCYGFTAWNTLWCSFKDEDWSQGGFEVDIEEDTLRYLAPGSVGTGNNLAVHFCQDHPGENLPAEYFGYPAWFSHGHSSLHSAQLYHAVGYGGKAGVWYLPTCTFIEDKTYNVKHPHDLFWRHPNHVTWNNSQSNYFFGDVPNSYYGSHQREGHNTEPWLKPVSLFQIFFDEETEQFEHHHLSTFLTAGKWNEDAPETCDYDLHENCAYNWSESPLPWIDSTGRNLFFTSTMGKYSHTDFKVKGITPYGGVGVFVALLEPQSNPETCIDSDNDGFGLYCVAGNDCDDSNYYINPNAPEVYDGIDNNCNAQIDCDEDSSLLCAPKPLFVDRNSIGGACSDARVRGESSITTPFCTIQRASDVSLPGDYLWIREGVYPESLLIDQGGTSDTHRITFRAFPGEEVVVRPGKRYGAPWSDHGSGVYQKSFAGSSQDIETLQAISYTESGMLEVDDVEDLIDPQYAAGINLYHIDRENKIVTVRLKQGTPAQVYFVDESNTVLVRAPYVTLQDLKIEYAYIGVRVTFYGLLDHYSEHGHHFSLIDSEVAHTYAEAIKSNRHYFILRNNVIEHSGVRHKVKNGDIEPEAQATAIRVEGEYGLIEGNEVLESSTVLDFRAFAHQPGYAVKGFVVRNNFFRGRVNGTGKDILFYNNLVYEPEFIALGIYYHNENIRVFNNVFHSKYGVMLSVYGVSRNLQFKNNIVVGTDNSRCIDFGTGLLSEFSMDRNLYDTCVLYRDINGTLENTFEGYQQLMAAYGQEGNSMHEDPKINLNPDGAEPYVPFAGSPARDAGADLSSFFGVDYLGHERPEGVWDIGPYEYQ